MCLFSAGRAVHRAEWADDAGSVCGPDRTIGAAVGAGAAVPPRPPQLLLRSSVRTHCTYVGCSDLKQ